MGADGTGRDPAHPWHGAFPTTRCKTDATRAAFGLGMPPEEMRTPWPGDAAQGV